MDLCELRMVKAGFRVRPCVFMPAGSLGSRGLCACSSCHLVGESPRPDTCTLFLWDSDSPWNLRNFCYHGTFSHLLVQMFAEFQGWCVWSGSHGPVLERCLQPRNCELRLLKDQWCVCVDVCVCGGEQTVVKNNQAVSNQKINTYAYF